MWISMFRLLCNKVVPSHHSKLMQYINFVLHSLTDKDIVEKYCRKVKIIGQVVWECTICGKKYLHQNSKLKEHVKGK